MTIELITGTPGAGKTTFAVSQRLVVEGRRKVRVDDDTCIKLGIELGTSVERRIVVAGIRGLKMDHERLPHVLTNDSTPPAEVEKWNQFDGEAPVHKRLPGQPPVECPAIAQNWWLWCKPGDLIVVDEAQFMAPRGTMGRKPPYWVQALEIHRHYGVDFIFITQHPGLIDPTIRALVGMHRHVRSVLGSSVCMVYVWDHASNPERYTNATKNSFVRRAKHYALFHSSVAHIAPPKAGRAFMWMVPLLACVMVAVFMRMKHRLAPDVIPSAQAAETRPHQPGAEIARLKLLPDDHPGLQGCYTIGDRCTCVGPGGIPIHVGPATCKLSAAGYDGVLKWAPHPDPLPGNYGASAKADQSSPPASASAQPVPTLPLQKPLVF